MDGDYPAPTAEGVVLVRAGVVGAGLPAADCVCELAVRLCREQQVVCVGYESGDGERGPEAVHAVDGGGARRGGVGPGCRVVGALSARVCQLESKGMFSSFPYVLA